MQIEPARPRHRQGLMIILDGVGDRPMAELDGRTPLEAAVTPHLDRLAARGLVGFVDPVYPGVAVGTEVGIGVLFGLRAPDELLPRGLLEAAGVGLALEPGDVGFRCNFATVATDGGGHDPFALPLVDRRAGRINEGTAELAAAIDGLEVGDGVTARLVPAAQFRAALRLQGPGLSPRVTDVDPGGGRADLGLLPCRPLDATDTAADHTARLVNRLVTLVHERLRDHPVNLARRARRLPEANVLLPRGAGSARPSSGLLSRFGLRAAVVTGDATVIGLGKALDMATRTDARFTADPATDLSAKVDAAHAALAEHDIVFLHIKGSDILSHDHYPQKKREFLERVDMVIAPLLRDDLVIAVTGDHSTPCDLGFHSGDPVPTLLVGPGGRADAQDRFGERSCMAGGLGRLPARGLLWSMLDLMGYARNLVPGDEL
jgi:2,3-bisphosphoglycerate-independent phosphoglycerate mutase